MKKGFTLIELLVVIAIAGILSSVVLAALQGAKEKRTPSDREYCEKVGRYATLSELPAGCLKYCSAYGEAIEDSVVEEQRF